MNEIIIRSATIEDAKEILNIYSYYVTNTAISWEYEVPSLEEFKGRIEKTLKKYPYLVSVCQDEIVGYSYAGPFVGRAAYSWSCEMTIYLKQGMTKHGIGRRLYESMEEKLKEMGILNLYACIGDPMEEDEYLTRNSEKFHAHMGYKKIGIFTKCGRKFGRWYNMIWMEKIIGEHENE